MNLAEVAVKVQLLIFLLCFHVLVPGFLYLAFMVVASLLFGASIVAVSIGIPPRIFKTRIVNTPVSVGLLPTASTVSFLDAANRDQHATIPADRLNLSELAIGKQLCLALGGPIVLAVVALATLPFADFLHHARTGLAHLFGGALHPFTAGQQLLNMFVGVLNASPVRATGIYATVLLIWILLPYFPSPTYRALSIVTKAFFGISLPTDINLFAALVLMLPLLLPCVGWCIAIAAFVLK